MKHHLLILAATAAAAARAGERTSASYTITADDSAASAGQRSTSASYAADHSVADSGIVGSSAHYAARQGYTGQLYDPAGLSLTAAPPSVNETGDSQLSAATVHDDGTRAPLPSSSVSWSVVTGPARNVSTTGLLKTDSVYATTDVVVRGTSSPFSASTGITVLDNLPDNYHNYAGDGIPDTWQTNFFGPDNPAGEAAADPDCDGQDNHFEFLAGVDPAAPESWFATTLTASRPVEMDIGFTPLLTDREYVLEYSTDLTGWEKIPNPVLVSDDGTWRILRDENASGMLRFYRITIHLR